MEFTCKSMTPQGHSTPPKRGSEIKYPLNDFYLRTVQKSHDYSLKNGPNKTNLVSFDSPLPAHINWLNGAMTQRRTDATQRRTDARLLISLSNLVNTHIIWLVEISRWQIRNFHALCVPILIKWLTNATQRRTDATLGLGPTNIALIHLVWPAKT